MGTEIKALKCPCCKGTFMINPDLERQVVTCSYCNTNLLIEKVYNNNNSFDYRFSSAKMDTAEFFEKFFDSDDFCEVHIKYKGDKTRTNNNDQTEQKIKKREQELNEQYKIEKELLIILMLQLFEIFCCVLVIIYAFKTKSWSMLWYGIPGAIVSGYGALLSLGYNFDKLICIDNSARAWNFITTGITGLLLISFLRALIG